MLQDHGMNANGKLLRRFYEPVILLSVLDPIRGARRPDPLLDQGVRARDKLWRNFLDQLCFLCDAEKGGNTVTAIAAERINEGTVFWLASNSNAGSKAHKYVKWILSQLNRLHDGDEDCKNDVREQLLTKCTEFCAKRINTYASLLGHALKMLTKQH